MMLKKTETIALKQKYTRRNLKKMYLKVVARPNCSYFKRAFIKCPECGEEILMIPTLSKMSEAIENHVKMHKDSLKDNPLMRRQAAMYIRLKLAQQVLASVLKTFEED